MARLEFSPTPIAGVSQVVRRPVADDRGHLARLFCSEEFAGAGQGFAVAQVNHTLTRQKGALRGMHFQHPPAAEKKLVTCIRGTIFDVAVDLRHASPTFLTWTAVELSAANWTALLIPEGCAHGFQALSDDCELLYLHSAPYAAGLEGALNAFDPRLAIDWPLAVSDMSARDRGHAFIDDTFRGVTT